jgi:hypothetical protein
MSKSDLKDLLSTTNEIDLTVTRFWTIQDNKAYSIAYIGVEPKYFNLYSIALKMFDSFQIGK